MYDVVIVGAGVVGTFIARELSKYNLKIILIEKDNDVSNGTTKANSAIVHAGYDAEPGSLKAKLNVKGNSMYENVCKELDVPFKKVGSIVIANNEEEMNTIKDLYNRGIKNGVPEMKVINREEVEKLEPNINDNVIGALYAPTCCIVSPFELAIALAENAVENGVELILNSKVTDIKRKDSRYIIEVNEGEKFIEGKIVVNCAGLYGDKISQMVSNTEFRINPRRGQYFILDKSQRKIANTVIFQCPNKMGKGVIVTPTAHGNILIGPDAEDIDDKEDTSCSYEGLRFILEKASESIKNIDFSKVIVSFSGVRAVPSTHDFIIEEDREAKGFINVIGIESPGLASSPAIAKHVEDIVIELLFKVEINLDFKANRERVIRFEELNAEEKEKLIKENPAYGKVICRCEEVTEGEIIDAIRRPVGARTLDGVKRRCRPGSGRCQGGFCGPRVVEIISKELGKSEDEILKSNKGSYMLSGKSKINVIYKDGENKRGSYDEGGKEHE